MKQELERSRRRRRYIMIGMGILALPFVVVQSLTFFPNARHDAPRDRVRMELAGELRGFRTAAFGMREDEVVEAAIADFGIARGTLRRRVHPQEKTIQLVTPPVEAIPGAGDAVLAFVLGHRSQRLRQVFMFWGAQAGRALPVGDAEAIENAVRIWARRQELIQTPIRQAAPGDGPRVLYQAVDRAQRLLVLMELPDANRGVTLRLSLIENARSPDVYQVPRDAF